MVVAFMALFIQYEFRPYKLDAMNTVKVMEAWQNLLCIVVLLIQDAHMFESDDMYELAGWALVAVDAMMVAVMVLSAWKRGACRPGNLDDFIDNGNDYVPPHITDDTVTALQEQHAGEMERLREQYSYEMQRLREHHTAESEQLRAESEQFRVESERTKAESERIKTKSEQVEAESEQFKAEVTELKTENTELRRRLGDSQ